MSAEPALALRITNPADQSTVKSGQTVAASVDLGQDGGTVTVRYYWYPELGETPVEQEDYRLTEPSTGRVADDNYWGKNSAKGTHRWSAPSPRRHQDHGLAVRRHHLPNPRMKP